VLLFIDIPGSLDLPSWFSLYTLPPWYQISVIQHTGGGNSIGGQKRHQPPRSRIPLLSNGNFEKPHLRRLAAAHPRFILFGTGTITRLSMCASAWTRRGPRGLPSPRIFMVLGGMKAAFVRPPPRDLGVRGASIVLCGLSCLDDLNSDLCRLCCSLHGLDTFWARGLRVEFLLKTESWYLRDAEVTWFTLAKNP